MSRCPQISLAFALFALSVIVSDAKPPLPTSEPQPNTRTVGVWQPPAGLHEIPIWPNGAPDMQGAHQPPESVLIAHTPEALNGHTSQAVFDVTAPTMTIFPPKGTNTGVAMIVFPGGGFNAVVITLEGTEICDWLSADGVTCVLLKYRVPGSAHHWDAKCKCHITPKVPRALQDAQRTIKLVRASAAALNIDPNKIGVMGFSAGGYMVAQASNNFAPTYKPVDATDKFSSRPDFAILIYPGHLCRAGGKLDPTIHVTKQTPPTFLLQAWDDPVDNICNSTLYANALAEAGIPAEVHLFAKGGHAFALRHSEQAVATWPELVKKWMSKIGTLK